MAIYDYRQLEELWVQAGGSRAMAPLMAAIATAESSGNSQARNPSGASGLWQIDDLPFAGDPFDPETNARMAVAKYQEQGLGAWTTYTDGAYKRFLRGDELGGPPSAGKPVRAHATVAQGGGSGAGFWTIWNTVPGTGIPIQAIAGQAEGVADVATALATIEHNIHEVMGWFAWLFVPSHWIRIICFVTGVPAVGLGIITMTKGTLYPPGAQQIAQTANQQGAPIPTQAGSMAPTLGILEVTVGAILLFIAFHNLPDNVQTFPQLLSYMQSKVSTSAASKERPQVAVD